MPTALKRRPGPHLPTTPPLQVTDEPFERHHPLTSLGRSLTTNTRHGLCQPTGWRQHLQQRLGAGVAQGLPAAASHVHTGQGTAQGQQLEELPAAGQMAAWQGHGLI